MNKLIDTVGNQIIDIRNSLCNYMGHVLNGNTEIRIGDVRNRIRVQSEINALDDVIKDELYIDCSKCVVIACTEYITGRMFDELHSEIKFSEIRDSEFIKVVREEISYTLDKLLLEVGIEDKIDTIGKSFEMLLSNSQVDSNGSVYTPDDIVDYMNAKCIESYFRDKDINLKEVKSLKILEPSVGAGAYVVNMIKQLYLKRVELGEKGSIQSIYKDIIKNNIYAIDIDSLAVCFTVCRLYMIVGEEVEHNIKNGNTIVESIELDGKLVMPIIDCIENAPSPTVWKPFEKLVRNAKDKRDIDSLIEYSLEMQGMFDDCMYDEDIAQKLEEYNSKISNNFAWQKEFKDVYLDGGFDIVVGNPPYVRAEKIVELKEYLERYYSEVYNGSADLFIYFYYKGYKLLKDGGILGYITSNKWFRAKYGEKLRKFIRDKTDIVLFVDFKGNRVFSAGVDTEITIIRKSEPTEEFDYVDGSYYGKEQ